MTDNNPLSDSQPAERSMSLFRIEETMQDLLDMLEQANDDGDSAAVEEIDKALQNYIALEVKKVDNIAGAIRAYTTMALTADLEADRLLARGKMFHGIVERIKMHTKVAMELKGVRKLQTPLNALWVQNNGSLEPVEITELANIPPALRKVTVTIPEDDWLYLFELVVSKVPTLLGRAKIGHPEPNNEAIRKELKMQVHCPECKGIGDAVEPCKRCGAKGTIPATVPGARLLPRGTHLRVK
jgi:hypothetical protein